MRLMLVDRIEELQPGRSIVALKSLSLTESYLKDHFPRFPIMPGVMMLETMYQSAAWLVRATDHFQHSLVLLREANNVKYSDFVQPGQTLRVTAEIVAQDENRYKIKCQGQVAQSVAVRGRLVLEAVNLADSEPERGEPVDHQVLSSLRKKFQLIYEPRQKQDAIEPEADASV